MPRFHIFLDSPASNNLTKTELDIGVISQPYVDIAHCIRAGFCVSHALREWVRIIIGFHQPDTFTLTLNPTTIRYLGTDERSILHIILRSQEARAHTNTKIPFGVTISEESIRDRLADGLNQDTLLLIPNKIPTWKERLFEFSKLAIYCPLYEDWEKNDLIAVNIAKYQKQIPRDVAILEVIHTLDTC